MHPECKIILVSVLHPISLTYVSLAPHLISKAHASQTIHNSICETTLQAFVHLFVHLFTTKNIYYHVTIYSYYRTYNYVTEYSN